MLLLLIKACVASLQLQSMSLKYISFHFVKTIHCVCVRVVSSVSTALLFFHVCGCEQPHLCTVLECGHLPHGHTSKYSLEWKEGGEDGGGVAGGIADKRRREWRENSKGGGCSVTH